MKIKHTLPPDDDFSYWFSAERKWKEAQPRMNQKELYDTFLASTTELISDKIKELISEYEAVEKTILEQIRCIQTESKNESEKLVMQAFLEQMQIKKLLTIEAQLKRFYLYRNFQHGKHQETIDVQKAKEYPIERLLTHTPKLRKMGQNYLTLCPLHDEKTPSFYLYTRTNSFYCYGCHTGGDVIRLTRLLYGYSFTETVRYLINNL